MELNDIICELEVKPISAKKAKEVAEKNHYMHRKPQVSYAFGLHYKGSLVGIVTYGTPASRHLQIGVCPSDPSLVIELNRVWLSDEMPYNTESWFISRTFKMIPSLIVVSYADTKQGHMGFMYRALNFYYAGWTDMERRSPRFDYVQGNTPVHSRDSFRGAYGYTHKVPRKPKVKYWRTTGSKAQRRRLEKLCAWAILDWNSLPPPTEHRHHKI